MQSRFYIHKLNAERKFSETAEEIHAKFYLSSKRWMEIMYCQIFYVIIWILFAAFQRKIAFQIILDDFRWNKWLERVFCRIFCFLKLKHQLSFILLILSVPYCQFLKNVWSYHQLWWCLNLSVLDTIATQKKNVPSMAREAL